jgi:hypothetical protein
MTLATKIKLTPSYDWKSIKLDDITGTGITGYGSNQDPVGFRRITSSGIDIVKTRIRITAPGSTVPVIVDRTAAQAFSILTNGYSIINTALGFAADAPLTDGIWKIEYAPYFPEPITDCLAWVPGTSVYTASFNPGYAAHFKNATAIQTLVDPKNLDIASINFTTSVVTFVQNTQAPTTDFSALQIGLGTTLYVPIAKAIKECLDNKVADETICSCDKVNCELVNKYLLYDAMFVNCVNSNVTKAQQIFDLLTTYCGDNCGC